MSDSPGKRLAFFRKSLGMNQRAFATALSVSQGRIGSIETDADAPSRGFLERISEVYGVNADWLLNGHGEQMRMPGNGFSARKGAIAPADSAKPGHGDLQYDGHEYAFVKRMALSVSAGSGLMPVDGDDADTMALPTRWFARQGISADLTVLVSVKGDSMVPAIPDGALVLIHVAEKMPTKPGIYAFNRDGQTYVKRILPSGIGKDGRPQALMFVSDNPAYPPVAMSGKEINEVHFIGRVRAVLATV